MFLQTGNISIVGPRTLKQFEVTRFQVLKAVDHFKVSVDVTFERILSYHVTNTFIPTLRCQQNVILCHMYFKRVYFNYSFFLLFYVHPLMALLGFLLMTIFLPTWKCKEVKLSLWVPF